MTSNGRWITNGAGGGGCNGHPSGIREVGEMPNLSVKTIVNALLSKAFFFLGGGWHWGGPLKNDGWKTTFLLSWYLFRGYVKLRGG